MGFDYKITVFTPTYNRAYIIDNLYHSLRRQKYTDFEWLVVDDGSKDETEQLFDQWMREENAFAIHYVKQENGGKCRAINRGLQEARGELFLTMDSDDFLTDDALERIVEMERLLPKTEKFCGFAAEGTTPDADVEKVPTYSHMDGTAFDLYGVKEGEHAFVFYTEVHRKYLYPEFPGEKFMTEAVTWNRMAWDGYKMRFYDDIVWKWEYKPDGLTQSGYQIFIDNPQGTALFFREKAVYFNYNLRTKFGMWYGYVCDARHLRTPSQMAQDIAMPKWLVRPIMWMDSTWKFVRGKR